MAARNEVRDFTTDDWYGLAGAGRFADGGEPLVYYGYSLDLTTPIGADIPAGSYDATVIVDEDEDNGPQVSLMLDSKGGEGEYAGQLTARVSSREAGRLLADHVIHNGLKWPQLAELGFKST